MSKLDNQLTFKQRALGGISLAVLIAGAYATPGSAAVTQFIYGGGATFPERVYRDIFNCYGNHSVGNRIQIGLTAHVCNVGDAGFTGPYKPVAQVLYLGVGSGNGKKAFLTHNPGNPGGWTDGNRVPDEVPVGATPDTGHRYANALGLSTGTNWSAGRGTNNPYPTVSFGGSDDPLLPSDIVGVGKYNDLGTTNGWGPALQFPTMIGAVGIGYNPAAGTWNENGVAPTGPIGAFNLVSLKTATWCGIYTGAITNWNNAEITADNGTTSITGGASASITVTYRSDGSGTTFLFANALIKQCASTGHPVPASWETAPGNAAGVSNNNWFINVNKAGLFPVGSNFSGQPGNNGIRTFVNATPGAVGYMTTDFIKPVNSGGPRSMNLQTWLTHNTKAATPVFKQPNKASATAIMVSAAVPSTVLGSCTTATTYAAGTSPDGKCSHNPINWAPTNPMPAGAAAYPIGGFTMIYAYSCYANAANGGLTTAPRLVAKTAKWGLFSWYFTDPATNLVNQKVVNSLSKNGFGAVPAAWRTGINNLLFTDKKTKIGAPTQTGTPCAAIPAVPGKGA